MKNLFFIFIAAMMCFGCTEKKYFFISGNCKPPQNANYHVTYDLLSGNCGNIPSGEFNPNYSKQIIAEAGCAGEINNELHHNQCDVKAEINSCKVEQFTISESEEVLWSSDYSEAEGILKLSVESPYGNECEATYHIRIEKL